MSYYLKMDGQEKGPYTESQLQSMWRAGLVTSKTLWMEDGMDEWLECACLTDILEPKMSPVASIPLQRTRAKESNSTWLIIGAAIFFAGFIALYLAGLVASKDNEQDAYLSAVEYAKQAYPGLENVSGFHDSIIKKDGDVYMIALTGTGKNVFGGPVRNNIGVQLRHSEGRWICESVKQR